MRVEVRPATEEDDAFSFAVTEDAMRPYVEATWGKWDPVTQRQAHAESFAPSNHWIVLVDGQAVGIVAAVLETSHVQLVKLYLRARARRRGIGALILSALLRSAESRSQPLRLRVLAVNTRAQAFYRRHGFRESFRTTERVFMEARPGSSIERATSAARANHVRAGDACPRALRQLSFAGQDAAVADDMTKHEQEGLLRALQARFEKNIHRHRGIAWPEVQARLDGRPAALRSLREMDSTGGEPDVIGRDDESGACIFCDCSPESPAGRRSVCYDREALASRKEHKPENSAVGMAAAMGIDLLTEERYRALQELGEFDTKTSSWVSTPPDVRKLGGALFCDRRYGKVFVYHNGAQSYYAARGFRGEVRV